MIFATTEKIEGKEHKVLGMVMGVVAYPDSNTRRDLEKARHYLDVEASELKADAVVGVKIAEVESQPVMYGTAVKFKK